MVVELSGAFQGMGKAPMADAKMLAVYAQFPAFAVSVKMIGPKAAVDAARDGFDSFLDSLKIDMSGMGSPKRGGAGSVHGSGGGFDQSKLRWDVPEGWQTGSGSSMRVVTLKVAGKKEGPDKKQDTAGAECWVIVLSGTAGGVVDNVNRWRSELQQPPLSTTDVDRLPRIDVLGKGSVLVEEEGSYQGQGGPQVEKAMLFGVVCPLDDVTVFIKMVGGVEAMRAAKNGFLAFCASLRVES